MAIISSGPLSLSQIASQFGGSAPHSLNEYYPGGLLVPTGAAGKPGGTFTVIPSSGAVSLNNYYAAPAMASASDITSWFWNNRAALYRSNTNAGADGPGGSFGTYYPGDGYTGYGHYNSYNVIQNYVTLGMGTPTVNPGIIYGGEYWTTFLFAASYQHSGGGLPYFNGNWSNYGAYQSYESGNYSAVAKIEHTRTASTPLSTYGGVVWGNWDGSNNLGFVMGGICIPGRWELRQRVVEPNSSWTSFVLQPGEFLIWTVFQGGETGAGATMSAGGAPSFYGRNSWYSTSSYFLQFNTSASPVTVTNSGSMCGSFSRLNIFRQLV